MGLLRYYYTTSNFANLRLKLYPPRLLVPGHRLECLTAAWADQQTMGTRNQGRTSCRLQGAASGHYHTLCHYIAQYKFEFFQL